MDNNKPLVPWVLLVMRGTTPVIHSNITPQKAVYYDTHQIPNVL